MTGKNTDSDGNVEYKLGGLAVQNLLLAVGKMNVTVVFLEPSLILGFQEIMRVLEILGDRRSDIAIGLNPLLPLYFSPWFQPTIPYEYMQLSGSFLVRNPSQEWKRSCKHTNYQYG